MTDPVDVSVIIGAYNSMPYVTKGVTSVLEQSIGLDRLEVIAVDDGSNDGTGAELDRLASKAPRAVRVVHQPNSGGPAGPRNRGIDLARGRYLFFLDADDYLGPEALERMVAMADRNHSDVVVGRRVGIGGRKPYETMLQRDLDKADLYESGVWWTLSAQKLFRRSFILEHGLRFPDLPLGQDQPFGGLAYLRAGVISVLASYDCYYLVRRDDGGNNTTVQRGLLNALDACEIMMRMVAEHVEPGERRDALMQRHFAVELNTVCLARRFLGADQEDRARAVARAQELLRSYYTPRIAAAIPVQARLKYALVECGDLARLESLIQASAEARRKRNIVDGGRVYAPYPFFRDSTVGISDDVYDITDSLEVRTGLTGLHWYGGALRLRGHAVIEGVDTADVRTQVVLRAADGVEHPVPVDPVSTPRLTKRLGKGTYDYDHAGFAAIIEPATVADGGPLPEGRWQLWLTVSYQGIARRVRLTDGEGAVAETYVSTGPPPRVFVVRSDVGSGLVLEVTSDHSAPYITIDEIRWASSRATVEVAGTYHGDEVQARLTRSGAERCETAEPAGTGRYRVTVPLNGVQPGRWRFSVELIAGDVRYRAATPATASLPRRLWWLPLPFVATGRVRADAGFEVRLVSLRSAGTVKQLLRRLKRRLWR